VNRVWKRFLFKICKGLGVGAYVLGSMAVPGFISYKLGFPIELGMIAGATLFVLLPMILFMIYDVYKDSKREIEYENRQLMNKLGKKY
jgi:hypothetical protein